MIDEFCDNVVQTLEREIEQQKSLVASGKCTSFESYKQAVGAINALRRAVVVVNEERKKMESGDDDQEEL